MPSLIPDESDDPEVPAAWEIIPHVCPNRPITHIHIMLVTEEGECLAQATVNRTMLLRWMELLDSDDEPHAFNAEDRH